MTDPDWPELRITDADIDAPEDAASATTLSAVDETGPTRTGLPLRWCAALTTVTLLAAAAAVGFAEHRGRTITTVRYQKAPTVTIDAGGCPTGDNCSPLDGLNSGLGAAVETDLPTAVTLFATETIDTSTTSVSRNVRIVELPDTLVKVAVLTQCRTDGKLAADRTDGLGGIGPTFATIVRSFAPGCSIAILADVPAGQRVPAAALLKLAANPDARVQ